MTTPTITTPTSGPATGREGTRSGCSPDGSRRRRAAVPGPRRGRRVVTEVDTRYLDEDGDGMLDAVEVVERLVAVGPGLREILSTRRILLAEVDDEGTAHRATNGVPG